MAQEPRLNQAVIYDGVIYSPGEESKLTDKARASLEERGFFEAPEASPDPMAGYNAQSPFLDTSEEGEAGVTNRVGDASEEASTTSSPSSSSPSRSSSSGRAATGKPADQPPASSDDKPPADNPPATGA